MKINPFRELDLDAVSGLPEPFLRKRQMIAAWLGWERDGIVPLVFADKPAGHRACWSCKWTERGRILIPDMWFPLENMSSVELACEMVDLVYRDALNYPVGKFLTPLLLDYYGDQVGNPHYWRDQVIKHLRSVRIGYPEFVAPWDPPQLGAGGGGLMHLIIRPGFGQEKDYIFVPEPGK